jgi:hypothetical protein
MLGFADAFVEAGHRVYVFNTGAESLFNVNSDILRMYHAPHLGEDNFTGMIYSDDWGYLFDCDMLLLPYPHLVNNFPYKPECKVVAWNISQTPSYDKSMLDELWTNCETTKHKLGLKDASVVYAPHSYLFNRKYSIPWGKREYDIVSVCSIRKRREEEYVITKELQELQWLHLNGYKVLGLFMVRTREEEQTVKRLGFEHYINIPRQYVAGFMGNAKILLHQSPLESCSLTVYEGLNSGCYPIVCEAGACREQLGEVGYVYNEFHEAFHEIQYILDNGHDEWVSIEQGIRFDRRNNEALKWLR